MNPPTVLNRLLAGMLLGLVMLAGLADSPAQTNLVTPAQWLASRPKPVFAPGHRLPHLSKFSWPYAYALKVEMATNWGYALPINGPLINGALETALGNTNSEIYKLISLCSNYPTKFRLQVDLDRSWPTNLSNGFWVTNAAGLFADNNTNTWQYRTNASYTLVVSPEAPTADIIIETESIVAPLRIIATSAPIAIIINGGERDLSVVGSDRPAWQVDPRVQVLAVMTDAYNYSTNPTGMSWYKYSSMAKSNALSILTAAVKLAVPNYEAYAFYAAGAEQYRYISPGYNWDKTWGWGWASDYINSAIGIPCFENYYSKPDSFTNATGTTVFTVTDLLTRHLNAVGYNIALGYTTNYAYVCGGWSNIDTNRLADIPRYTGFLKCLYTSGTVGANAGYYAYPVSQTNNPLFGGPGFDASFPANSPPHWLLQIEALSRVHAQFSYLENFIWGGSLLPGDGNMIGAPATGHFMSRDQPAYEFTNTVADAACRVLARKLNTGNEWLITAWAAAGSDRTVTVTLPPLGQFSLLASATGSVYRVTNNTFIRLNEIGLSAGPGIPPAQLKASAPQP